MNDSGASVVTNAVPADQGSVVLEVSNLSKVFKEGPEPVHVLQGVSMKVHAGELLAIVGQSGSGKTTLLHMLGGLDKPSSGSVSILGKPFSDLDEAQRGAMRNQHIGFIYQMHHLLPEFTALENVAMPVLLGNKSVAEATSAAEKLLESVGLSHRLKHKPSELSGGERQRVAIARALVNNPSVVLADEPTGNLDSANAMRVYELMLKLSRDLGIAFVLVTHDQRLASQTDRQLIMEDGVLS